MWIPAIFNCVLEYLSIIGLTRTPLVSRHWRDLSAHQDTVWINACLRTFPVVITRYLYQRDSTSMGCLNHLVRHWLDLSSPTFRVDPKAFYEYHYWQCSIRTRKTPFKKECLGSAREAQLILSPASDISDNSSGNEDTDEMRLAFQKQKNRAKERRAVYTALNVPALMY